VTAKTTAPQRRRSRDKEGFVKPLDEKVAVVTGAARGVGFGIAEEFVANGATVVLTDIEPAELDDAVAKLGRAASGYHADVTNLADMEDMYAEVVSRHGRLDAVVANAGVGDSAPLGTITERQFDFIFSVNVKGVLFTVQAALPHLGSGGTVVIIGSTASIQALYGMSLYGGSKAAIRQFVRGWIQDVKGSGVRINVLSPGAVDTPSLRIALEGASGANQVEAKVREMGDGNPIGRLADPREMGKAAVFLTSDASSFITGVELFVDGGMAQTG
jgi:NAD(P)-dependent dehydrogenase (short-subunit alcohol dehydrogenase family)